MNFLFNKSLTKMNYFTAIILTFLLFYFFILFTTYFFQRNLLYHPRENNYFGWGAKEAELTISPEKPGRWDLQDNKMYITAPLMEVVEIIQDMEGDGEQIPSDWWSGYAVEGDDLETFSQENIMENISWDYITAIKDFSQSMMHSPNLHDGEAFHEKYDRIRQGKGDPLYNMTANRLESIEKTGKALSNESHKPKGKRKLFKLAQMLTNTNSEKAHAKLHKVCARLGLSADQCHAISNYFTSVIPTILHFI